MTYLSASSALQLEQHQRPGPTTSQPVPIAVGAARGHRRAGWCPGSAASACRRCRAAGRTPARHGRRSAPAAASRPCRGGGCRCSSRARPSACRSSARPASCQSLRAPSLAGAAIQVTSRHAERVVAVAGHEALPAQDRVVGAQLDQPAHEACSARDCVQSAPIAPRTCRCPGSRRCCCRPGCGRTRRRPGSSACPGDSSSVASKLRICRSRSASTAASSVGPSTPQFQERLLALPSLLSSPFASLCLSL